MAPSASSAGKGKDIASSSVLDSGHHGEIEETDTQTLHSFREVCQKERRGSAYKTNTKTGVMFFFENCQSSFYLRCGKTTPRDVVLVSFPTHYSLAKNIALVKYQLVSNFLADWTQYQMFMCNLDQSFLSFSPFPNSTFQCSFVSQQT